MSPDPSLLVPDDFARVPSTGWTVDVTAVGALDESALDVVAVRRHQRRRPARGPRDRPRPRRRSRPSRSTPSRAPRSSSRGPAHRCSSSSARARPPTSTRPPCGTPPPTAARSTAKLGGRLGIRVPQNGIGAVDAGRALTEGALLARYRYSALRREHPEKSLTALALAVAGADTDGGGGRHPHRPRHEPRHERGPRPRERAARLPHRERDGRRGGRARRRPRLRGRVVRQGAARRDAVRRPARGQRGQRRGAAHGRAPLHARRARRRATSAWSARGSCTTPAASASSPPTPCTCS